MKRLFLLTFLALITFSCSNSIQFPKPNGGEYPFIVLVQNIEKGEAWYSSEYRTSSYVGCDSFQMVTPKECNIWAEGKKMTIKCNLIISPASNPNK